MQHLYALILTCCVAGGLPAQPRFNDQTALAGIGNTGQNRGVAVVDYDNDGWEDLYFCRLDGPNYLYRNNGDGTFSERAAAAGLAFGGKSATSVWGDLDNDGWVDMVLGNRDEPSRLYRNNGDGTFTDMTTAAGFQNNGKVQSVLLADYDNDGLLDIYFANLASQNTLLRNLGNWQFVNRTFAANVPDDRLSMGAVFFDMDNDGDQDLYLTHDAEQPYILYRNNGGSFTDVSVQAGVNYAGQRVAFFWMVRTSSVQAGVNYAGQGMGVDVGDVNNDGFLDIYITNLYENTLFLNDGDGTFTDMSTAAGVTDRGMGWGTVWFDCDNDGRQDIYVSNETPFRVDGQAYPNILYYNRGDGTFQPINSVLPLASPHSGYGVGCADFNRDGRPDLALANSGTAGNQLLINEEPVTGHWLGLRLEGVQSNRSAIGARVVVRAQGQGWTDQVIAGSGYASQNSLTLHFGLGETTQVDEITVYWPSGRRDNFMDVAVDRVYQLREGGALITSAKDGAKDREKVYVAPNPNNGSFTIDFALPQAEARLDWWLLDAQGRTVDQRTTTDWPSGRHRYEWQAPRPLTAGIYYLKAVGKEVEWQNRLVVVDGRR